MKLQVVEGNNMVGGRVYVNPVGRRVEELEMLFEMMKAKVTDYQEAGFEGLVVGDFNAHIELGTEQSSITGMGGSCWIWLECVIYV